MSKYYILQGREPVPVECLEWAKWFEGNERRVAYTDLGNAAYVSTVFLGLNHSFTDDGPPLIFESMSFEGDQERYSTWEEAEAGHKRMVRRVRRALAWLANPAGEE
jgi:hypothetical protein